VHGPPQTGGGVGLAVGFGSHWNKVHAPVLLHDK